MAIRPGLTPAANAFSTTLCTEDVPCHHIPLNREGTTIATAQSEEELRENVKHWLKRTIARIEAERARQRAESAAANGAKKTA